MVSHIVDILFHFQEERFQEAIRSLEPSTCWAYKCIVSTLLSFAASFFSLCNYFFKGFFKYNLRIWTVEKLAHIVQIYIHNYCSSAISRYKILYLPLDTL